MPILTLSQQQSVTHQKVLSNTSDNLISGIANTSLLGDNNYTDKDSDLDAKAMSNLNKNITGKNNDDLCKKNLVTNIEELFQQV